MSRLFCFLVLLFVALPCCPESVDKTDMDRDVVRALNGLIHEGYAGRPHIVIFHPELEKLDVPAILKDLESGNPHICIKAVTKLAYLGRYYRVNDQEDSLPNLKNHLKKELESGHPDSGLVEAFKKEIYLTELHRLRDRKKDIISAFRNLLASENKDVRHAAAIGLLCLDPSLQNELSPVLIETIHDGTQPEQVSLAVSLCGELRIKESVPAIVSLINKSPEFIPKHNYGNYWALENIDTPEARKSSFWPMWREDAVNSYSQLDFYLSHKPLLDFLIALVFILLFLWSRRYRRKGIMLNYKPLLIPAFLWGLQTARAISLVYRTNNDCYFCFMNALINNRFFDFVDKVFIVHIFILSLILEIGTSAGLIPWLLSLRKLKRQIPSVPVKNI